MSNRKFDFLCYMNVSIENYLKCLLALSEEKEGGINTNALASKVQTKPSSVTDMLKKLNERGLVSHTKYYGTTLTPSGKQIALSIVRKHRLWEVFLVNKLKFQWDEVHEIAEQLEHIKSEELINRLDRFLEFPQFDPHGDPIPDESGNYPMQKGLIAASDLIESEVAKLVAVKDSSSDFLHYLSSVKLALGSTFEVLQRFQYDQSLQIKINRKTIQLSAQAAANLLVIKN